jgi:hypothetical protein
VLGVAAVQISTAVSADVAYACAPPIKALVRTLAEIHGRLQVGISYSTYQTLVTSAEIADSNISTIGEPQACVYAARIGEKALSDYKTAYDSWQQCIQNASGPPCNKTGTLGDSFRQGYWAKADNLVFVAVQLLGQH